MNECIFFQWFGWINDFIVFEYLKDAKIDAGMKYGQLLWGIYFKNIAILK